MVKSAFGTPHLRWIEEQDQEQKTDFIYFSFAGNDRLVTRSSRAMKSVLQAPYEDIGQSSIMVDHLERGVGRTIITADGIEHKV
jgi:hypothetical protein